MSESTKFRLYLTGAGLLYAWGLGMMGVAHEESMSEGQYLWKGILPVLGGVLLMVAALQSYLVLYGEDEDDEPTPRSE
jgi:hypothetical protein